MGLDHIFRAYDIRGIYPTELNEKIAFKIGAGFGTFNPGKIVVGMDARLSGPLLRRNVIKGLVSAGSTVVDVGMVTTPMVMFAIKHLKCDGGIMVSASVDGNEYTMIENLETGERKLVKVGDFIENNENVNQFKKFAVLAFDSVTGKASFQKIKGVYKHKINEPLYELKLSCGRRVRVTESHSIFTFRDGKLISVPTKKLKIGDFIPVVNNIPPSSIIPKINLVKSLWPFRNDSRKIILTGDSIMKIALERSRIAKKRRVKLKSNGRKFLIKNRKKLKLTKKRAAKLCGLSVMTLQRIELGHTRRFVKLESLEKYLKFLRLDPALFLSKFIPEVRYFEQNWKDGRTFNFLELEGLTKAEVEGINICSLHGYGYPKNSIRNVIEVSPKLLKLIGYYMAEGNLECEDRVCFNLGPLNRGHEKNIAEEIISSCESVFGIKPKLYKYKTKTKVAIDNIVVYGFFAKVLNFENKRSNTKSLPEFIYTLPKKYILQFLRSLFLGDGSIGRRSIKFSSTSKELAVGICYLLSTLGVHFSLVKYKDKRRNRKDIYDVLVLSKNDLKKISKVWIDHYLSSSISMVYKRSPRLKSILNDLILLKLKEMKHVKASSKYVYDFSVESETFIAGNGVCCHNSHNPKDYNGFRFFDKDAIPISYELGINKIQEVFEKENFLKGDGKTLKKSITGDYIDFILKKVDIRPPFNFKIAVDAFSGSAGPVLVNALKKIGIEFHAICCEPDGNFPNHGPDPTKKENITHLQEKVIETNSDFGIATDGDGDRFVVVDERGDVVYPAAVFSFFIKNMLKEDPKAKIIYEVLSSKLVDDNIKNWGGIPLVCRVGNTYITQKMVNEGALMGGEVSGHYYFRDVFGADDAIFAALKFIQFFKRSGIKLSDFTKQLPEYFYEEMRVLTIESEKVPFIEALKKELKKKGHKIDETDGVKVMFENGWALLRPSNTEPKISIAYEANNEKDFGKIKRFVMGIIKRMPGVKG